jgi:hypothetical protein
LSVGGETAIGKATCFIDRTWRNIKREALLSGTPAAERSSLFPETG